MTDTTTSTEAALVHDVHWNIDYRVKLGRAWSRFMRGLQNQELWGTRCGSCQRSYVPAQEYCEACYEKITDWIQLEPIGTLRAATIVYQGFEGGPDAPYVVGAIEIDGTDSLLMHFISGVDLSDPTVARTVLRDGLRVQAVWSDERIAAITDIRDFAVVSDDDSDDG